MWSRDRGLGLETEKCGLGLERCGLGLGLKGVVLVLGVWSRSFAFDLGLAPLVDTRVEYLLNVVEISGLFRDF